MVPPVTCKHSSEAGGGDSMHGCAAFPTMLVRFKSFPGPFQRAHPTRRLVGELPQPEPQQKQSALAEVVSTTLTRSQHGHP